MNIYDEQKRNRRLTWLCMALFAAIFLLLGAGLDRYFGRGLPVFTVGAFAVSVISCAGAYRYGDRMVLAATSARPPADGRLKERQWNDVVGEMSIAAGIPAPRVYIIDDPGPNAFAAGRSPRSACVAATTGLLERCTREELLGVAGHEMSHVRNYDTRLMLVVTVLAGSVILLADWAFRALFWGRTDRDGRGGPAGLLVLILWIAAALLAPLVARIMSLFIQRRREFLADASGAELARDPLALASALAKIGGYAGVQRSYSPGTGYLWIGEPRSARRGWSERLFSTHPPLEERIDRLEKMAYEKRETVPKVS